MSVKEIGDLEAEDEASPFNESPVPFLRGERLRQAIEISQERLSAAQTALVTALPYYAPLIYGMRTVYSQSFPAAAGVTPDANLMLHPGLFAEFDLAQAAEVLLHEVGHLRDQSSARTQAMLGLALDPYDPNLSEADRELYRLSNIAADVPINDGIEELQGQHSMSHKYMTSRSCCLEHGKDHEEVFPILVERVLRNTGQKPPSDKAGGNCGSGGGGVAWKAEQPLRGQGKMRERSQGEVEAMLNEFAEAIRAHEAKNPGTTPGNLLRWADLKLKPPQVPWQTKVRNKVNGLVQKKRGEKFPTFSRWPRIQGGLGFDEGSPRMPDYQAPGVDVHVWQDTSGSMATQEFASTFAEIKSMFSKLKHARVFYGSVDAQIYKLAEIGSIADVKKKGLVQGGGGTVFTDLFAFYDNLQKRQRPAVVVIATDGYIGGLPEAWRTCPVIWLVTPNGTTDLPFGDVIVMKN